MNTQICQCGRGNRCICFSHPSLDAPPASSTGTARAIIEGATRNRAGFLKDTEVAAIAADPATRLQLLLVRCGNGRFIAPAQDVPHFIEIIEDQARMNKSGENDYIRDVSVYNPRPTA